MSWPSIALLALASRLGFYQWDGVGVRGNSEDLLTQARGHATAAGGRVFRLYLGARFDYQRHPGSAPADASVTPARLLALPHYRAVMEDPALETIILTTYTASNGDDLNLLRPWSENHDRLEREQIRELTDFLYEQFGSRPKTVIIANSEADEKMLEIMNYTGSPERAVENLTAWTRVRHQAIEQARGRRPNARLRLRLLHGFEISLVNLAIAGHEGRFRKSPQGTWNALRNVVPKVRFDLLLYSTYESINSPFETQNADTAPQEAGRRLRRDLDRIRERSRASLSPTGRRLFGDRFVAAGELGFARDRFEHLPSGGVLPRLMSSVQAAIDWGCPYIVLWQVFDAPRAGGEQYGFGLIDRNGRAPRLQPGPGGCDSIRSCVAGMVR